MAIVRGELGCFSHPGIGDGGSQKRTEREIDNLWLLSPLEQKIQLYISSTALTMISYLFWEIHKNEIKLLVTFQPPTISKENFCSTLRNESYIKKFLKSKGCKKSISDFKKTFDPLCMSDLGI